METWRFDSPDPDATQALAAELGRSIGAEGLVIGLIGPLGAGKTVFVKGLASGLGIDSAMVSSPTFVIAQQYAIPAPDAQAPRRAADASDRSDASEAHDPGPLERPVVLHHLDLYRLESETELESVGFFDLFERGAVLATEWADRFPDVLGPARLEIRMSGPAADGGQGQPRTTHVHAYGRVAETILEDWVERVERRARIQQLERRSGASGDGAARPERPLGWVLALALGLFVSSLASDVLPESPGDSALERGRVRASAPPFTSPSAPLSAPPSAPLCERPRERVSDAWGTLRVECGSAALDAAGEGALESMSGIGGLLFGVPLDLNRAARAELEALPDLGPQRVAAILGARAERPFTSVRDLARVPGIGPKTVARLSPWLKVEAERG